LELEAASATEQAAWIRAINTKLALVKRKGEASASTPSLRASATEEKPAAPVATPAKGMPTNVSVGYGDGAESTDYESALSQSESEDTSPPRVRRPSSDSTSFPFLFRLLEANFAMREPIHLFNVAAATQKRCCQNVVTFLF
jgi:hypothetical protein